MMASCSNPQQNVELLSPFETDVFQQCWTQYMVPKFPISKDLGDFAICQKKLFRGLFTFNELLIKGWNAAWSQDLTEVRIRELKALSQSPGWDYFRVNVNNTLIKRHLQESLMQFNMPMLTMPSESHYCIDLSQGWDSYIQNKPRKHRQDIRRKIDKVSALNPQLEFCDPDENLTPFFDAFFQHHIAYWNQHDPKTGSYFSDPSEQAFIKAWTKALQESGHLIVDRFFLNGDVASMSLGIRYGDAFYGLLSINTGHYSEYIPGIVSLYLRIEKLAALGVTTVFMGPGDYPYKIQASNRQEACSILLMANPHSWRGKRYLQWQQYRQQKNPSLPVHEEIG